MTGYWNTQNQGPPVGVLSGTPADARLTPYLDQVLPDATLATQRAALVTTQTTKQARVTTIDIQITALQDLITANPADTRVAGWQVTIAALQSEKTFLQTVELPDLQAQIQAIDNKTGRVPFYAANAQIKTDAQALFPHFNGTTNLLPERPADFTTPTPASFAGWHAMHQVAFLQERTTPTAVTVDGTTYNARYARIGADARELYNYHALLSQDGTQVISLNALTFADVAKLSIADQRVLSAMPIFRTLVADKFGLVPNSTSTDAAAERTRLVAALDVIKSQIEASPRFNALQVGDTGAMRAMNRAEREAFFKTDPSQKTTNYHYLFIDQLEILTEKLANMAIFAPDAVVAKGNAILERFTRLERFQGVTEELTGNLSAFGAEVPDKGVNSLDNLTTVKAAVNIFLGVEVRLRDIETAAVEIARTGVYQGRTLDSPNLVFVLQSFENYRNEAEAEGKAEELNQQNKLLQDYTAFQKLLNQTVSKFDPVEFNKDDDNKDKQEELRLNPTNEPDTVETQFSDLSTANKKIVSMFDRSAVATGAGGAVNSFHPIEADIGVQRPTENLVHAFGNLIAHAKPVWDRLAINIGEQTKLLNQDSQLQMDSINRLNKEKNRHYDLATNTLRKMSGILRGISDAF